MAPLTDGKPPRASRYRAGLVLIALTAAVCLAALLFRTPLRSRFWAWQIVQARHVAQRVAPLTCLCNAREGGRWGTEALLSHRDPEIRQYGLVVLQHVKSDWSRRRSLEMFADPSSAVREMAALALAFQGDNAAVPELERLYAGQDSAAAAAACLALARLGTPEAATALTNLVRVRPGSDRLNDGELADVNRRAALVDALATLGGAQCAAALFELLDDCRPCDLPTRDERLLAQLAPLAAERGLIQAPATQPPTRPGPHTIADRAAAALARITQLNPGFTCDLPQAQREDAVGLWRDWIATRGSTP